MKIEVLVSTMHQNNIDFIKSMNLKTPAIIGNQSDEEKIEEFDNNGFPVKMITTKTRGLSRNRNITLEHASGDICLLTDDDLIYHDDYVEIITKAFQDNPKADLIIFNLDEEPITRFIIQKKMKVGFLNYMRFGSVRIAFKLQSIRGKRISFDTNFGSGAPVPYGEDTIFLHDCLKAKLKVIALITDNRWGF